MTIARVSQRELRGVRVARLSVPMPGVRLVGVVEGGLGLKKRRRPLALFPALSRFK